MARVLRGDIVWAQLDPALGREQAGSRPVVVLSREVFNEHSGTVIAMAITSRPQRADYPLSYELVGVDFLPKRSWVKISQVRTLSVNRLGRRLGRVPPEVVDALVDGLGEIVAG